MFTIRRKAPDMLLSQIKMDDNTRAVVARQGDVANIINDVRTMRELVLSAIKALNIKCRAGMIWKYSVQMPKH